MDNKQIAVAVVGVALAGKALVDYRKTRKQQAQIREEIRLETEKEITAIWAAAEQVKARIDEGAYRSIADIDSDFRFFRMTARIED